MATTGENAVIIGNGRDLSSQLQEVGSMTFNARSFETPTFGASWITRKTGLIESTFDLAGLYDGDGSTKIGDLLFSDVGTENIVWTVFPIGDTIGNEGIGYTAQEANYSTANPVDGLIDISASLEGDGQADLITGLHDLSAETATGSSSSDNNSASSANGGAGYLQVTSFSGTSIDVLIEQSSTGAFGGEETTLVTFSQVTAANQSEIVTVSGTVQQYLRATWTIAGSSPSITFQASFGRR